MEYAQKLNVNPLITVDNCIEDLLSSTGSVEAPLNHKGEMSIYVDLDPLTVARKQLKVDGYMIEKPIHSGFFYLTGQGRQFLKQGGYANLFKEQEEIKKKNKEQVESVIKTNNLTRINIWLTATVLILTLTLQFRGYYISEDSNNKKYEKLQTEYLNQKEELKKAIQNGKLSYPSMNRLADSSKKN